MRYRKKRSFLAVSIIIFITLIMSTPLLISYFYLPKEIKLIAGEEHLFNFDIPIKANILKGDGLVIKDVDSQIIDTKNVSLNKPIYVSMEDEGSADVTLSFLGVIPLKTVSVQAVPYQEVIPCGKVVGIKVDTDGVLVLGIGEFEGDNEMVSPCKGLLEAGDIITACNGQILESKEDLRECIEASDEQVLSLTVLRESQEKEINIQPYYSKTDNEYKIGLWIRDSTQGIGTITYVNPETGYFGALGHGITDTDTHQLMPVRQGDVQEAVVTNIKKGEKGAPGEISGVIDYSTSSYLGRVEENTSIGIYGMLNEKTIEGFSYDAIPIAFQDEVHEGTATLLIDLAEKGLKEYEVIIQKVSKYSSEPSKGMVIKIVDEELLTLTNGIIQGMSGSPILQDGKLIGAITHVFIQDPTRGYGIFIENMLNNEKR